jgi:hypothetical protein
VTAIEIVRLCHNVAGGSAYSPERPAERLARRCLHACNLIAQKGGVGRRRYAEATALDLSPLILVQSDYNEFDPRSARLSRSEVADKRCNPAERRDAKSTRPIIIVIIVSVRTANPNGHRQQHGKGDDAEDGARSAPAAIADVGDLTIISSILPR